MRKVLRLRPGATPVGVLVLLISATFTAGAADPALLALAPPDANFVLGVRVADLAASPLLREGLNQAKSGQPAMADLLTLVGFERLGAVEEVLLAGRIAPNGSKELEGGILVATGDFVSSGIADMICTRGCGSENYAGLEVRTFDNKGEKSAFALLDARHAMMGADADLRRALDRRARGVHGYAGSWVQPTSGAQLWIAAKGPFDPPNAQGAPPMVNNLATSLDSFGLSLTLDHDLSLGLELLTNDAASAQELYQAAQGLLLLTSASQQQDPAAKELLESLDLRLNGRRMTASLRVPSETLTQMAKGRMSAGSTVASSNPAPVRKAAPRRREGVIRIHGLEEEPVVVEADPRRPAR